MLNSHLMERLKICSQAAPPSSHPTLLPSIHLGGWLTFKPDDFFNMLNSRIGSTSSNVFAEHSVLQSLRMCPYALELPYGRDLDDNQVFQKPSDFDAVSTELRGRVDIQIESSGGLGTDSIRIELGPTQLSIGRGSYVEVAVLYVTPFICYFICFSATLDLLTCIRRCRMGHSGRRHLGHLSCLLCHIKLDRRRALSSTSRLSTLCRLLYVLFTSRRPFILYQALLISYQILTDSKLHLRRPMTSLNSVYVPVLSFSLEATCCSAPDFYPIVTSNPRRKTRGAVLVTGRFPASPTQTRLPLLLMKHLNSRTAAGIIFGVGARQVVYNALY